MAHAHGTTSTRVLLCSACKGDAEDAVKRCEAAAARAGRFDVLLAAVDGERSWEGACTALRNAKLAPRETVFFATGDAKDDEDEAEAQESTASGHDASGNAFVARCVLRTWHDLLVGQLRVAWCPSNGGPPQVQEDVDVLLTDAWPMDVARGASDVDARAMEASNQGNQMVAATTMALRPRYVVVFGSQVAYEREPFKQDGKVTRFIALTGVGAGPRREWMRALAIQKKGEENTQATPSPFQINKGNKPVPKWAQEDEGELPDGTSWRWNKTEGNKRPREGGTMNHAKKEARSEAGTSQQDSARIFVRNLPYSAIESDLAVHFARCGEVREVSMMYGKDGKPRGLAHVTYVDTASAQRACTELDGEVFDGRKLFLEVSTRGEGRPLPPMSMGKPVDGCPFCLSNPNADAHLVVSVAENAYVCVDKGAINGDHVLIIPVEHWPCIAAMPPQMVQEIKRYEEVLRHYAESRGKALVLFERFMQFRKKGGNHCHINAVCLDAGDPAGVESAFRKHAEEAGFGFEHELPSGWSQEELRARVGEQEYFCATLPDGRSLLHLLQRQERHPMNFGRDVVASLCGAPERGDWRVCGRDHDGEEKLAEEFKQRFQPFDIMS